MRGTTIRSDKEINLKLLFEQYPILKIIDDDNDGIISNTSMFTTLIADEQISSGKGACQGMVLS